ncbi:hypothetical protein CWS52_20610, partial [Klebsiella michiganensis]|nr:hypothetical protein [Klebsiella michiganensis]
EIPSTFFLKEEHHTKIAIITKNIYLEKSIKELTQEIANNEKPQLENNQELIRSSFIVIRKTSLHFNYNFMHLLLKLNFFCL